ncbi:MAG: T9SS type A sorting domain-containing protein [bacterium]
MNTTISKTIIITLILSCACGLWAHVELDYPQGGETFTAGEMVTLQWHIVIPHNTLNWDLFFSSDGGTSWNVIQQDLPPSELSYPWEVPAVATTQGKVRVVMDNSGTDYQDSSLNFTIEIASAPPNIDVPAQDTTIECGETNQEAIIQAWLDNHGGAKATGFCGNLTWTHDFTALSDDCGITGNALVTFTVSDDCGSSTTNATLTVIDTTAPVIDIAAQDTTIECGLTNQATVIQNWLDNQGGANAGDICGNVNWTNDFPVLPDSCDVTSSLTVTFIATDECGNNSATDAIFTLMGTVGVSAPTLSDFNFEIFPNPVREILKIEFDKEASLLINLSLIDELGKTLWHHRGRENRVTIPVMGVVPGIYFLQVETNRGVYSRKVVIE